MKPQIIIARTVKGKGIRIVEEETAGNRKHGVPLTEEEAEVALSELGSG